MSKINSIIEGLHVREGVGTWDAWMNIVKNNDTYKKIEALCKKHGYEAKYAVKIKSKNDKLKYDISITDVNDNPELTLKYIPATGKIGFEPAIASEIQRKYEEYKKFIDTVDNASILVKELNKINLEKLETYDK